MISCWTAVMWKTCKYLNDSFITRLFNKLVNTYTNTLYFNATFILDEITWRKVPYRKSVSESDFREDWFTVRE